MADEAKQAAAVYVGWSTFKNVIDGFGQGVPNQIDRTVFPGLAGGVQSQLLAGLKFLGLIDDKGKPTATLQALAVPDETARKKILRAIIEKRYSQLFAIDLTKATPAQVNETIASAYNVSGETKEKAVRFFLSAAEYVGVPVSSYLKPKGNGTTTGPRKRRPSTPRPRVNESPRDQGQDGPTGTTSGTQRSVTLKSGGVLTLSATLDVMTLSKADRDFVFSLIDRLTEYERDSESSGEPV